MPLTTRILTIKCDIIPFCLNLLYLHHPAKSNESKGHKAVFVEIPGLDHDLSPQEMIIDAWPWLTSHTLCGTTTSGNCSSPPPSDGGTIIEDGGTVYVDSLTHNSKKFKQVIEKSLKNNNCNLVVENYLDESVPVVSAASIIAKVNRDEAVKEIEIEAGQPIGVGYPHDALTIKFVEKLIKEKGRNLPHYVRKSWVTTQVLQEQSWQRKVKDFIFRKKEKCKEEKI